MIVYDYNDPFSTLWWMHGSVIPHVIWVSTLCAINGAIAVYFKESYNYYLDHTPHLYLGTTVGVLLVFKGVLAYHHYTTGTHTLRNFMDCVRTISVHANAYGHCTGEPAARDLVTGRVNIAKHVNVLYYTLILHLRKQRLVPPKSLMYLYLQPKELSDWQEAEVRPLLCMTWVDRDIASLRDKGVMSDQAACMISGQVAKLVEIFGTMERIKNYPTLPFALYQLCNWAVLLFCLSVPASIASHNTDYVSCTVFSFIVSLTYFGMNQMGNDLQEPFGLGVNDLPLERWGVILEHELYASFPMFRFRFEHFALFKEDFVVYPPDDPRSIPKKKVVDVPKNASRWNIARIKITAAVRLGSPRLRKFREAKSHREKEVDVMVRERLIKKEETNMSALLKALQAAAPAGRGSKLSRAEAAQQSAEASSGASQNHTSAFLNGDGKPSNDQDKKPVLAPAELLPQTAIAKQAGKLVKKHPGNQNLQRMLLQITNPKVPESDKQAILALMHSEVAELEGENDDDE